MFSLVGYYVFLRFFCFDDFKQCASDTKANNVRHNGIAPSFKLVFLEQYCYIINPWCFHHKKKSVRHRYCSSRLRFFTLK